MTSKITKLGQLVIVLALAVFAFGLIRLGPHDVAATLQCQPNCPEPHPIPTLPAPLHLPFSYYKLNEASGSGITDSTGANHGTAVGAAVTTGLVGNGRSLNGTQDYLNLGNLSQFNNASKLTISAWVKFSSINGIQAFVTRWGNGGNAFWSDFSGGVPRAAFGVGEFITTTSFSVSADNHWHAIAWVYDGTAPNNTTRLKLFVDNERKNLDFATYTVPASLPTSTTPVLVGSYDNGANFFLNAGVDEIGFWNEAISDNMIANLYNQGLGITYDQIQHAYDLHNNSLVLLAHTHDFLPEDLANAKLGGVTALTAKLTTDGLDWDRDPSSSSYQLRVQQPWMFLPQQCELKLDSSEWRSLFLGYLNQVQGLADNPTNHVMIIRSVADFQIAKDAGKVGVILGSEGANQLLGDLGKAQEYYDLGWRETQLRWAYTNLLVQSNQNGPCQGSTTPLCDFGRQFIRKANRLGILIDVAHVGNTSDKVPEDKVLEVTTAPVIRSHEVNTGLSAEVTNDMIRDIAASGGGHGVIALHFLVNNSPEPTLDGVLNRIDDIKSLVGVEHVALGPDYMPDRCYSWIVPVTDLGQLTLGLVRRGYSDDDIKKILGENLIDLYSRVWNPVLQGPATLQLCKNNGTDINNNSNPACQAATANRGEGDMSHRPVNCRSANEPGVIGLQVSFVDGAWVYYSNLDSSMKPCVDGSTLVASWTETTGNAQFKVCPDNSTDAVCLAAATNGGAGTTTTRAISCINPNVSGAVGLQLVYGSNHWSYLNAANQPVACTGSALVADWSGTTSNGTFRLCENLSSDPVCANAAQTGGNGTSNTRVINCANSSGVRGQVGLQVTYVNNQWMYYKKGGSLALCLEGSPLVVNFSTP